MLGCGDERKFPKRKSSPPSRYYGTDSQFHNGGLGFWYTGLKNATEQSIIYRYLCLIGRFSFLSEKLPNFTNRRYKLLVHK